MIKYTNQLNQEISREKTLDEARYNELIFDNETGTLKSINRFLNGSLQFIKYYISPSESEADKINEIRAICNAFSLIRTENYHSHTIENVN